MSQDVDALRDDRWDRPKGFGPGGTKGRRGDVTVAAGLIAGFEPVAALADEAFDADPLCAAITRSGAEIVIPHRRNRQVRRACDQGLSEERHRIERFFDRLEPFRRVATRYDEPLADLLSFVRPAAIAIRFKWSDRRPDRDRMVAQGGRHPGFGHAGPVSHVCLREAWLRP